MISFHARFQNTEYNIGNSIYFKAIDWKDALNYAHSKIAKNEKLILLEAV